MSGHDAPPHGGPQQPVDLTNCDREPIHIPGAVQPHGCLLAFAGSDLRLTQWSANAHNWFGESPRAGATLPQLFPDAPLSAIEAVLTGPQGIVHPFSLAMKSASNTTRRAVAIHHYDGILIVEVEEQEESGGGLTPLFASLPLRLNLAGQHFQATLDVRQLYSSITEEVRAISGFDRVMLYRFLEDGHGAVVGESVDERFEPFLGLHYPATDIPQQARRLYVLNTVRSIADIHSQPVPLEPVINPVTGRPLDLSFSCFRAVSPIHIEYLRNMGVGASMSVSILRDRELWGLIACHHYSPRPLSFEQRAACEILGLMAGTYLTARERDEANAIRSRRRSRLAAGMKTLVVTDQIARGIDNIAETLCRIVEADGVAICWRDRATLWGATPQREAVARLASQVLGNASAIWHTDRLSEQLAVDAAELNGVCGCLATPFEAPDLTGLLFFRNEYAREVRWAGDPNKPTQPADDGGVRLSPRLSFAAWKESVTNRSREWSFIDIEMGEEIRSGMVELLSRRAAHLARINEELAQLNSDLDAFAYAASHDLREPVRGLGNTVFLLQEELGASMTPAIERRSEALRRLTGRMEDLIEGLLRLSRAGSGDLSRERVDMREMTGEAAELALGGTPQDVEVVVQEGASIEADYLCLRELVTNLISNAVKYNDQPVKRVEIGVRRSADLVTMGGLPADVVYVRDNGIGIPEDQQAGVFQIFRRLHDAARYGEGTGAGLAIVKKIVQRHGGRIWMESSPGAGTTCCFTLEATIS